MRIIRTSAAVADALDSMTNDDPLRRVLQQRVSELADYGCDIGGLACFVLIDPGDTLPAIEAELNLPIATNAIDGSCYGDTDFTPSWEWIQDHGGCWEIPIIMSDGGFGHVLLIPDVVGVDPTLLNLCCDYADQGDSTMAS